MGSGTPLVEVDLLGQLQVRVDGRSMGLPQGQLRCLLAALALQAGHAVALDTLVDCLWGEDLPAGPRAGVQNNVSRLRRLLGPDAISTVSDGYLLAAEPNQVDVSRFLALADQIGAERGRRDLIDEALGLWRGDALVDVGSPALEREWLPSLSEHRLTIVEARVDDDIDRGRYAVAIADLREWTSRHPLRESMWSRLLSALHRSGRSAEALSAYEQIRHRLADELGADPSAELQDHYRQLLAGSDVAAGTKTPDTSGGEPGVPRELPAAPRSFTGRSAELSTLVDLLSRTSPTPDVVAVHGPGGVGKSALAIAAAHQLDEVFPDGQLYIDLAGATPGRVPVGPQAGVARLLFSLGVSEVPPDLDAAAARLRSELDGKRLLVMLDNAFDEAQVRQMLPGSPGCGVLITSRKVLPGLHQAAHLQLDALLPEQAQDLLGELVGIDLADAESEAVGEIARLCGGLPLGLRIAAARVGSRPSWSLASFAARLADSAQRLRLLRSGDLTLTAAFEVSYQHLTEQEARAFRLCAIPQGPDLELDAAAALLDLPALDTEDLLETLVDHALLETPAPGRYRYHDLLRLFAQQKATSGGTCDESNEAAGRLLAYYVNTMRAAFEAILPGFKVPESVLPVQHPGRAHDTPELAMAWVAEQALHILAAIEDAVDRPGLLAMGADLLYHAQWLQIAGYDRERTERIARRLAETAAAEDDKRSEGLARYQLGILRYRSYDLDEAITELDRAADLAKAIGDRRLLADSWSQQGSAFRAGRRTAESIVAVTSAIEIIHQLGDAAEEAQGLATLARAYLDQGDIDRALATANSSDQVAQRLADPEVMASASYARGVVLREAGRYDEATAALNDALEKFRKLNRTYGEANLLYHLAETRCLAGDFNVARDYAQQCLRSSENLGVGFNIGRVHAVLGKIYLAQGNQEQARTELHIALDILCALDAPEAGDIRSILKDIAVRPAHSSP